MDTIRALLSRFPYQFCNCVANLNFIYRNSFLPRHRSLPENESNFLGESSDRNVEKKRGGGGGGEKGRSCYVYGTYVATHLALCSINSFVIGAAEDDGVCDRRCARSNTYARSVRLLPA